MLRVALAGDADAAIGASNTDAEPGDFGGSVGPTPEPAIVPLEARPVPEKNGGTNATLSLTPYATPSVGAPLSSEKSCGAASRKHSAYGTYP